MNPKLQIMNKNVHAIKWNTRVEAYINGNGSNILHPTRYYFKHSIYKSKNAAINKGIIICLIFLFI